MASIVFETILLIKPPACRVVSNLPQELKDKHPEIEWHKIAGLRNRIVHDYLDIDHDLIWHIIDESVPEFKIQIQNLIQES